MSRPALIPGIVALAALLLALAPLPIGYYTFLRVVVTAAAVWILVLATRARQHEWIVPFAIAAALFNPVVPVWLDRGTWVFLDLLTSGLFAVGALKVGVGGSEAAGAPARQTHRAEPVVQAAATTDRGQPRTASPAPTRAQAAAFLGVRVDAPEGEVLSAFLRAAAVSHPYRFALGTSEYLRCKAEFANVVAARDVLLTINSNEGP